MRTFIVCTILVFCVLFNVEKVEACLCKPQLFPKQIDNSEFIFIGKVIEKVEKDNYQEKTRFKIEKIYKSTNVSNWHIETAIDIFQNAEFYCEFNFAVGKTYFVFASEYVDKSSNIRFSTSQCAGNEIFNKKFFQKIEKEDRKSVV